MTSRHDATTRTMQTSTPRPRGTPLAVRLAVGILIIGHGLIHLIGTTLLWRLGEVGDFRYGDVEPSTPQWIAYFAGAEWLAAALVFIAAGIAVIAHRKIWTWVTLGGIILSLPAVIGNAQFAAAGIVLNVVLLGGLAAVQVGRMRRKARP